MHYRLAKKRDLSKIAEIHYECSIKQNGGFMHKLGVMFLKAYYSILINEKWSLILIAEDDFGILAGFHSGSILPIEHKKALRRKGYKFILPILFKLFSDPALLIDVLKRRKSLSVTNGKFKFITDEGPRAEYWAWSPSYKGENKSLSLRQKWCQILNILGFDYYYLEVDSTNKLVLNYYKLQSAECISEISLNDGRKRYIFKLKTIKN